MIILAALPRGINLTLLIVSPILFYEPSPAILRMFSFPFSTFTSALNVFTFSSVGKILKD
jgi:hypothetical protein